MKNTIKNGIIFGLLSIILVLVLISSVSATMVVNKYTNDFTLSSPNNEQLKACSCEMKTDLLIIDNVGNFPANYQVEIISPASEWMTLSEEAFSLAPKHRKELINYIDVPCGETGVSDYVVRVTSSYGRTEYLHRTLRVDQCQNVVLSVEPKEYTTNLCQPVDYDVRVKNVGTYAETYQLSFGSYDEFMEPELKEFYLKPGEAYEQTAVLTLPCTFYGEYDIPFLARGSKNNVQDEETAKLIVENQFDHSIAVDTEAKLCSQVKQEIAVSVKNEIDIPNDFNINLRGPGFIDVQNHERTFSLEGDETKELILEANPKEGQEGDYTLTIEVESDYGEIEKTRDVQLTVNNCYDFSIEVRDLENNVLEGDKSCCGMREYLLNVRNRGETEETYNILTGGPSWFRAEEITVRLLPGESTNVRLYADLPCVDASYELPLTVINNRFNEVNETIIFPLTSQTERTCHMVMINDDEFSMNKDQQVIPVIVEHNGTEGGLYELELNSQIFTLQEAALEIWPGEKKVIHFETVENLTDYEFGRYINQPLFTYTLENNPLATVHEDIDYNEHVGTNLKDKNFLVKAWEYLAYGVNWCAPGFCGWTTIVLAAFLVLVLIAFVVLALMTNKPVVHPASINAFRVIMLALVIVVFVLLAIVKLPDPATLYEMPAEPSEHFVTIYQDGRSTLNLDTYFEDPDMDALSYTASQPKDIAAYIDGNELTLVPDRGFAGENKIVITAEDGKGGIEDSPVLSIYVVPMKDMSFMAWWMRYCVQINLFFLLLLLLLTLIMTFLLDEREPSKKKKVFVVIPQHGEYKVVGKKKAKADVKPPIAPLKKKTARKTTKKAAPKKAAKKTVKKTVKKAAPKKAVKKTIKKKPVKKAPVKKAKSKAKPKPAPKKVVKKTRPMSTAHRKAMDRALVSSEEHEMKQVLRTHGKRETQKNIKILRAALKKFKRGNYKPKNRKRFYAFLKEKKVLNRLTNAIDNTPQSEHRKAMDRALVSSEEHEMKQVLRTHDKRETAKNVKILRAALVAFKKSKFKPKNRVRFYQYLKDAKVLGKLESVKKATPAPVKKKRPMTEAHRKAIDRALVSSEEHEMRFILQLFGKRETNKNIATLREALKKFKRGNYKPKNRERFYKYLVDTKVLNRLQNTISKVEQSAQSKALDRALVSTEEHEMKYILQLNGKQESAANVKKLRAALVQFKKSKYSPKNRLKFYKFLQDKKVMNVLANKKGSAVKKTTAKKATKKTVAAKKVLLVGAKDGQKVHKTTCLIAQRIPKGKRVTFKSKHEALVKGYGPCKVCQSFD